MQRPDSRANDRDDDGTQKHVPGNLDAMDESSSLYQTDTTEQTVARESESDSDSNEDSNDETQLVGSVEGESDFGDTELEKLVMLEGPQQILQLILHTRSTIT
ncbi:unnamed protein product [Sphagnum tenellum]